MNSFEGYIALLSLGIVIPFLEKNLPDTTVVERALDGLTVGLCFFPIFTKIVVTSPATYLFSMGFNCGIKIKAS